METFKLTISTPDGNFFEGDAIKILLRGESGDLAVLANHTPLVTTVKPCTCKIELEDGKERFISVERGLLSVSKNTVTLMSGSTKWL